MSYFRLMTALPALPKEPPALGRDLDALVRALLEEVQPQDRPACELVLELYGSPDPDSAEAQVRARHEGLMRRASALPCAFLRRLVRFEVSLREALAVYRKEGLKRAAAEHLRVLQRVEQAQDPLQKMRALDAHRMQMIAELCADAPFSLSEVLGYLARARLLMRYSFAPVTRKQLEEVLA